MQETVHTTATHRLPGIMANDGLTASVTVTGKLHLLALPAVSVATHCTVLVPTTKEVPLGGSHKTVTPGELSVAVTL